MLCDCYIHEQAHAQCDLCDWCLFKGDIKMFLGSQVSWLVETFNNRIFSDTINVIKVKLCMMVLFIELYHDPISRSQECQTFLT